MTRRIIEEENIRKIQKIKRSYFVSLPIRIMRTLTWQHGQKVVVESHGKEIVIRDWKE